MQRKKGSVVLKATTVVSPKGAKSFQIRGDDVNFVAVADDEVTRDDWVSSIHAAITVQKEQEAEKMSRRQLQKRGSEELVLLRILQARGLAAKGRGGSSSPYCVAKITHTTVAEDDTPHDTPSEEKVVEEETNQSSYCASTKVINDSTEPVWNSQMEVTLSRDKFPCVVVVDVFSKNSFGKDRFLGRTTLCLNDTNRGHARAKWFPLGKRSAKSNVEGQVQLQMYTSFGTTEASTGTTPEQLQYAKIGLDERAADYAKFFTNLRSHPRLKVLASNPFQDADEQTLEDGTTRRFYMRTSSYTPEVLSKSQNSSPKPPSRPMNAVDPQAPPVLNLPPSSRRWPHGEEPILWNPDIMLLCPSETHKWYKVPGQLLLSDWRLAFLMDDRKSAMGGKRHIPDNWR